ncbi:MAG: hypothetical protein VB080_02935 [Propionicimonas sp.]|uniref:hypothetical protein n=1 Tax=Propionicimonas sp. TaxID=1955623 RepID=UPI002B206882|nr:hypothetical protein [Propionicimonas sp.]MEA4943372.1 hypothetical protein [Propionicimonas sp.]
MGTRDELARLVTAYGYTMVRPFSLPTSSDEFSADLSGVGQVHLTLRHDDGVLGALTANLSGNDSFEQTWAAFNTEVGSKQHHSIPLAIAEIPAIAVAWHSAPEDSIVDVKHVLDLLESLR